MLDPNSTRIGPARSDEGEFTADDQVVRPAHSSNKSSKDFKKVLNKGSREQKDDEENATAGMKKPSGKTFADAVGDEDTGFGVSGTKDDEENASSEGTFSLFGMGRGTKEGKPKQPPSRVDSPAEMFKQMASSSKEKTSEHEPSPIVAERKEEKGVNTHYTQEQPDLAYINPLQTAPVEATNNAKKVAEPVRKDLGALIDQIVKAMYTIKQEGRTETVLTLQHPPLLKDAQIVVTSFDSARGQFNISFQNLTQAAQALLGAEVNRQSLLTALHDKGYNVQILTMTTIQETIIPVDDTALRDQREGRGQGEQQRQGRQRDEEEA